MSAQAGRSLSLQEARALGLDSRVLERLIGGAAVDNHARDLGLGISDAALLEQIMQDPNFKDATGNFSPASFQQALRIIGMTEQGYFASQRETQFAPANSQHHRQGGEHPKCWSMRSIAITARRARFATYLSRQEAAGRLTTHRRRPQALLRQSSRKFTQPEYRKVGILAVTPETVKER